MNITSLSQYITSSPGKGKSKAERRASIQTELFGKDPPSISERVEFIAWADSVESAVKKIIYTVSPPEFINAEEDKYIIVNLCGSHGYSFDPLPLGLYCIDLPVEIDDKFRDPVALAVMHMCAPPAHIKLIPEILSVAVPAPRSHDVAEARLYFYDLISNSVDPNVKEWASGLLDIPLKD